ncbi:hypothetical protein EYF80_067211 [Liparis tanakae]|uniref:Uncharacterized protein n=1 Tax=Liparis tanakae TaxID=230148 RepID=A0A4Z2E1W2_9TELE|nr:hypothetical protein EYF80_067211 [Liparis tanakae]
MANGAQEDPAHFNDSLRVYYLYNYINEALKGETPDTRHLAVEILYPRINAKTDGDYNDCIQL